MKKNRLIINRRNFIQASAASLAFPTIIPSSVLGKSAISPSNKITVGKIGTGSHGVNVNLKSYLTQPDARVVAVCDVDRRRMKDAKQLVDKNYGNSDCTMHDDFRDILARPDIDAVMISTPDHWHVPISIMAIKAGKDVQCEKPTLTIQEGRELVNTVKKYGAVYQTSTEDRAAAVYHRMAELVRNGRIGKLHTVKVRLWSGMSIQNNYSEIQKPKPVPNYFNYDMWLGPAPEAPYTPGRCHWNFRWIYDYSGGMLTDWGAHLLDTAQWGADTETTGPVEINGKGVFPEKGLYDTANEYNIDYLYKSGVKLNIESSACSIHFYGTDGWVGNTGWRGRLQASSDKIKYAAIGPEENHLFTCVEGEHRNFLDSVKSRKNPYFPAEIGHRCCSLLHLGNISMRLGRKLYWDPDKEQFLNDEKANSMRSRAMRGPWLI
jgi:myo-inositol 2-dehydrogenase / D-chiro-inositol 1-dehydrogenase